MWLVKTIFREPLQDPYLLLIFVRQLMFEHTYMKYEFKRKLLKVRFMFVVLHFLLSY
jgi:hypothetical protein